jgi:CDP-diacylglycerol pyrophosphatase
MGVWRSTWFKVGAALFAVIAGGFLYASFTPNNSNALWQIVHDRCVPNETHNHDPSPCAAVSLGNDALSGYAILKDRDGASQYLLIPTDRVVGIEDPRLSARPEPRYFEQAWAARNNVFIRLGKTLPRDDVALAINSAFGRSQGQLHIHIDCVRADVRDTLHRLDQRIGYAWAATRVRLDGHPYRVMKIAGSDLRGVDVFGQVSSAVGVSAMRWQTIAVIGATFSPGNEGFYLLTDQAEPAVGDFASAANLLDHNCALKNHE